VAIADFESEISGDRSPATLLVEEIGYECWAAWSLACSSPSSSSTPGGAT
jgi:hypothetical protein